MALCISSVAALGGHENEGNTRMVTAESLSMISYNYICDAVYMANIKRIVFLKAFMNFETHPTPLKRLKEEVILEIRGYIVTLEQYINDMKTQIEHVGALPPRYMMSKLDMLIARVYNAIEGPEVQPRRYIGELPLDDSPTSLELKDVMENIKAELQVKPFDHTYLTTAKEQIENNLKDIELQSSIPIFIEQLEPVLTDILKFVISKKPTTSEGLQYLIDFFDVFGTLIPRPRVNQLVLRQLARHPTHEPVHLLQEEPQTLKDIRDFDEFPSLINNPYYNIIAVDKLFSHDDKTFHKLPLIQNVYSPSYTYHPNWLKFFDIPRKQKEGQIMVHHEIPETKDELIKDAHTYIYYFYINARHQKRIPPEMDEGTKIPDLLYNDILTTDCYTEEDKCDLARILPRPHFSTHYMIMLALLKPFTSRPAFEKEDLAGILNQTNKHGADNIERFLPTITPFFSDLRKDTVAQKTAQLDNDLRDFVDELKKAQKDEVPDHFTRKKNLKQKLNAGLPKVEEKFTQLYPGLSTLPQDGDGLTTFLDDIDTITNTISNGTPETGTVLFKIVGKKLNDIKMAEEEIVRNNLEKQGMEQPEFVPENKMLVQIKKKINEWTLNQIFQKSDLPDDHGFIKYLENTMSRREDNEANNGKPFFKDHIYNMLRRYDLYIFMYRTKLKYMKEEERADNFEKQRLKRFEDIDVDKMAADMSIFENTHLFEFMPEFFDLFSYFELDHSVNKESKHDSEYVQIFDELYKFLIEVRARGPTTEDHPRLVAYRELLNCMSLQYDRTIKGSPIPYPEFAPSDADDIELTNDEFTEWDDNRICRQSYSRLSDFYYFLYIDAASAHEELIAEHGDFFSAHLLINTDKLYNYLRKSNNALKTSFENLCSQVHTFACFGYQLYNNIATSLATDDSKLVTSGSIIGTLIAEKIEHLQVPQVSQQENSAETMRVTIWNVIMGMASTGNYYSTTYSGLDFLIDTNAIALKVIGMEVNQSEEEFIELLARFIALRYNLIQNTDTVNAKYVEAVEHFMETQKNKDYLIVDRGVFLPSSAKFLVDYIQKFEHFQEIARVMVANKGVQFMLRWIIGHSDADHELRSAILLADSIPVASNIIAAEFLRRINDRKDKLEQVKKTQPKSGMTRKPMGGLGGLGGYKKATGVTSYTAQKNVQKPKDQTSENKVTHNADSVLVSEITASKINLAFGGKGQSVECVMNDLIFTGVTTEFVDRPDARTILESTPETRNDPLTIIDFNQGPLEAAAKHNQQVTIVEENVKREELDRRRRRRVVV